MWANLWVAPLVNLPMHTPNRARNRPFPPPCGRTTMRILSAALPILTSVAALGCLSVENAMVYHPRAGEEPYAAPPPPLQDVELKTADGTKIHARWAPNPFAQGAILFCHGTGGNVEGWGGP